MSGLAEIEESLLGKGTATVAKKGEDCWGAVEQEF